MLLAAVAVSGVIGILLGIGIGGHASSRATGAFLLASEARYSRAMFCFAPPQEALRAAELHLQRLADVGSGDEDYKLIQRERAFAAAAVAVLRDRMKSPSTGPAWVAAQKECRAAEYRDCSREWLARVLRSVCENGT